MDQTPDLAALLKNAWDARKNFHEDPATDCYRVFHGYVEGFGGLSIDRYGTCAIINKKADLPYTDDDLVAMLTTHFPFETIVLKSHQNVDAARGARVRYLRGEPSGTPLRVKERGDFYFADPDALHSNGLFLDARPARRWLKENAGSRRIFNMFAHTGSLGLAAKLGGATEVVHIDKSREAMAKIRHNYEFNGLKPDDRGLLTGDIYFHLPRAIKWGQKFQGVILDPPPLVPVPPKAPKHRPYGQDFWTLIEMTCNLLDRDAWLLCIYHDFRKSHDVYDQEIIQASGKTLERVWRGRADDDFVERDDDRWTRMSAFRKIGG